MPELPEVETIARGLRSELLNAQIVKVNIVDPKVLDEASLKLVPLIENTKISGIYRRAKLLLLELENLQNQEPLTVMAGFHLKMTGRLLPVAFDETPHKHTRLFFDLITENNERKRLFFDDMRRFGYCKFVLPSELHTWNFWHKLGLEPLEITNKDFASAFFGRKGKIKALLLNQEIIVGIGNIYADESLFQASIKPDTLVQNLTTAELFTLHDVLVEILKEAIKGCGSSIKDYRTAGGEPGAFQNKLQVYGKAGQPCPKCNTLLSSMKVGGRSTVYCCNCQTK
ncbi:bifunctional DNA-formamidopyrimidine glycosylase/DNA-(apurinic or apyrimidinic site) lyase [Desulfovibrio litoralis]|uniref:Formamidopyrimidine-DNA glycosylase n=1 Tax=Desulfovibrio litoralis DSM 11393 TaxID=1121455 RepID=A0A1M7T2J6_9BACT|nr:bifunctional DNA-formamidopyrimidine glycosylase/DNA-(apurinic or apyrimidinic site) lyase [Desulfovibrio litoralis]SHN64926.1 DNA-(apurinic or apyrimidinic site) lyase [Desulfovibrio litoralis DSM 11393]